MLMPKFDPNSSREVVFVMAILFHSLSYLLIAVFVELSLSSYEICAIVSYSGRELSDLECLSNVDLDMLHVFIDPPDHCTSFREVFCSFTL